MHFQHSQASSQDDRLPPIALSTLCMLAIALTACTRSVTKPGEQENDTKVENPRPTTIAERTTSPASPIQFTDTTEASKVDFEHFYDGQEGYFIAESIASGVASLDYDNDGRADLYFPNGHTLPVALSSDPCNHLYRNLGDWHFSKVPLEFHDAKTRFSVGVAAADFDNDGFVDLIVNNVGLNSFFINQGDGTFIECGKTQGIPQQDRCGAGVAFADFNGDSNLDLYIGNYVKDPLRENPSRTTDGYRSYPGPLDFEPDFDTLLLSNGDSTFRNATIDSGIREYASTSMGMACWDFDSDGDQDVLIVNDVDANTLLANDGTGNFTNIAIEYGVAFSYDAQRNGNMGVDLGDFNRDGLIDLFSTTYSNDLPVLYEGTPQNMYLDVAVRRKAGTSLGPHANWGTAFADFDLDGDEDIFIANGHTDPSVGKWAFNTSWKVKNTLLINKGGIFQEAVAAGSGLAPIESSRGICVEDFDGDGDSDIVVLNALARPTLMRNDSPKLGYSLRIRVVDPTGIRDGTGTVVTALYRDGYKNAKLVLSGRSYQSSFGSDLLFAVPYSNPVVSLEVKWPGSEPTRHQSVALDQNQEMVIIRGKTD